MGNLAKTAFKATHDPLGAASDLAGKAIKGVGQALGLTKSEADKRKDRYRQLHADIRKGNWAALRKAGSSRFAGVRAEAWWANKARDRDAHAAAVYRESWLGIRRGEPAPSGPGVGKKLTEPKASFWSRNYSGYSPGVGGGNGQSNGGTEWEDTSGDVPGDAEPSSPAPVNGTSTPPAQSAPNGKPKKKPCPPGSSRNPATGRCRKDQPASDQGAGFLGPAGPAPCGPGKERNPATGRCVNKCAFGPRGPDGRCPRKVSSRINRNQAAVLRKAEVIARRVVKAGVGGALAAVKAASAGLTAGEIAVGGSLVALAAISGWLIGRNILTAGEDKQQAKADAAVDRIHARTALAQALGVYDPNAMGLGLTLDQQQAITAAYKRRIALIDNPLGNVG